MLDRRYPKTLVHPAQKSVTAHSPAEEEELVSRGFAPVTIPEFSEYPITLNHPDHVPAREVSPAGYRTPDGKPPGGTGDLAHARLFTYAPAVWEPEQYPPVVAQNSEEERRYAAEGYVRGAASDGAAFSKAVMANFHPQDEAREFVAYPKWVTSPSGDQVLVKSAADEATQVARWNVPPEEPKRMTAAAR